MIPRIAPLALAAFLVVAGLPAMAQNMVTVPMEVVYLNNPNLVPRYGGFDPQAAALNAMERGDATIFRIRPQYMRRIVDGPSLTELTLGGSIERSSNTALSANRALPNVGVRWERNSPTGMLGLRATLEEESTREAEFADFGRAGVDGTLRRGLIGATWDTELSASTGLELAISHARVTYDTPLRRDYDETEASARYRWQYSATNRYALTASTAHQRRDGGVGIDMLGGFDRSSRTGLVLSHELDLSEGMTLAASAGAMRTGSPDSRTRAVGSFRFAREGERFSYDLEWRRALTADAAFRGYTRADTFATSLSYLLTVDTRLTVGASHTRTLDGFRDQGSVVYARLRTELTPFWAVTGALEHRRAQRAGGANASGHAVTLGLVYTHPDF